MVAMLSLTKFYNLSNDPCWNTTSYPPDNRDGETGICLWTAANDFLGNMTIGNSEMEESWRIFGMFSKSEVGEGTQDS